MVNIRKATIPDLPRIAEMVVFNYRLNFYHLFKNDDYYFSELQVPILVNQYKAFVDEMWVYDDGAIKGFLQISGKEIKKLFVEPVLQNNGIGSALLKYAISMCDAHTLWAWKKTNMQYVFMNGMAFKKQKTESPKQIQRNFLFAYTDESFLSNRQIFTKN